MKDVRLKCIYSGPMRGDCCSHSQYEPIEPTTVRELCEHIISNHKGEWGSIGIKPEGSVFCDPCIEYAYGEYIEPLESKFSQEILDSYVELIDWDGGWSAVDWEFTLKTKEEIKTEDKILTATITPSVTHMGTPCLICGESVEIRDSYDVPKICDKCKEAVLMVRNWKEDNETDCTCETEHYLLLKNK